MGGTLTLEKNAFKKKGSWRYLFDALALNLGSQVARFFRNRHGRSVIMIKPYDA
jgi:hypothetical protein